MYKGIGAVLDGMEPIRKSNGSFVRRVAFYCWIEGRRDKIAGEVETSGMRQEAKPISLAGSDLNDVRHVCA
ncbi:hypothetical protein, partial [Streptococcus pneumoniae]|uniref:hypothetical protein n=1 Tax=Streptococcus pneumoniae TaxID=1313 RepID=UPI001E374D80